MMTSRTLTTLGGIALGVFVAVGIVRQWLPPQEIDMTIRPQHMAKPAEAAQKFYGAAPQAVIAAAEAIFRGGVPDAATLAQAGPEALSVT